MKRRVTLLLVLLLAWGAGGAIVNVAVAHPSRRAGYGQAVGLILMMRERA